MALYFLLHVQVAVVPKFCKYGHQWDVYCSEGYCAMKRKARVSKIVDDENGASRTTAAPCSDKKSRR
eukprot:3927937-Alexandrium_andersonii.AAC.1